MKAHALLLVMLLGSSSFMTVQAVPLLTVTSDYGADHPYTETDSSRIGDAGQGLVTIQAGGYYVGTDMSYDMTPSAAGVFAQSGFANNGGDLTLTDSTLENALISTANSGTTILSNITINADQSAELVNSRFSIQNGNQSKTTEGTTHIDGLILNITNGGRSANYIHGIVNWAGVVTGSDIEINADSGHSQLITGAEVHLDNVRLTNRLTTDTTPPTTGPNHVALNLTSGNSTVTGGLTIDFTTGDLTTAGTGRAVQITTAGTTLDAKDVSITMDGDYKYFNGILASGTGSAITVAGLNISMNSKTTGAEVLSEQYAGVKAYSSTVVTINDSETTGEHNSIEISGEDGRALHAVGGKIIAENLSIVMAGNTSNALEVSSNGTITMNSGDITTNNASAYAVSSRLNASNSVNLNSVAINSAGTVVFAATGRVTIDGSSNITSGKHLVQSSGASTVSILNSRNVSQAGNVLQLGGISGTHNLNIQNTALNGDLVGHTGSGMTANVSLLGGASLNGAVAQNFSKINVSMSSGSMWEVAQTSTMNNLVANAGATMMFDAVGADDFTNINATSVTLASGVVLLLDYAGGYEAAQELLGNEIVLFRPNGSFTSFDNGVNYDNATLKTTDGLTLVYERGSAGDGSFVIRSILVPEPTTATLGLAAMGLLALRRRKIA